MNFNNPTSPAKTSTLEEFINLSSKTSISYNNLSFIEPIDDIRNFPIWNVLSDYQEEINRVTIEVELSEKEYRKYIYNPKILAYDLYGSTELFFIILMINGICTAKEFNTQKIKLLKTNDLKEIIEMVYNANIKDIDTYNENTNTTEEDYW